MTRWPVERCLDFGCLLWRGPLNSSGYAGVWSGGRFALAHVLAYLESGRVVPAGWVVDHWCRRRLCVEPRHLEAVTRSVNEFRKRAGYRLRTMTTCPMGHAIEAPVITPEGGRLCRTCVNELRAMTRAKE